MRLILIIVISILSLSVNGQTEQKNNQNKIETLPSSIRNKSSVIETVPSIEYNKSTDIDDQPVYYMNGKLLNPTRIKTIDLLFIENIHVEKKEIEIKGKKYYGQIYLKMKDEYSPKLISLTDLKEKYTNLTNSMTIFLIDNEVIKENYDKFIVDEKYILKIIVDKVEEKKLNINVIRLMTKSKENIEKSEEIRIRGNSIELKPTPNKSNRCTSK